MSPAEIQKRDQNCPGDRCVDDAEVRQIVRETVRETLITLGVDMTDPLELQADLRFLRQWRRAQDAMTTKALATLVGVLILGFVALVVTGFVAWAREKMGA